MQTEVMAVLPSIPAGLCLLLSLLACSPALLAAWRRPTAVVFASGVVSEPCEVHTIAGENGMLWIACFAFVFGCFFHTRRSRQRGTLNTCGLNGLYSTRGVQ